MPCLAAEKNATLCALAAQLHFFPSCLRVGWEKMAQKCAPPAFLSAANAAARGESGGCGGRKPTHASERTNERTREKSERGRLDCGWLRRRGKLFRLPGVIYANESLSAVAPALLLLKRENERKSRNEFIANVWKHFKVKADEGHANEVNLVIAVFPIMQFQNWKYAQRLSLYEFRRQVYLSPKVATH